MVYLLSQGWEVDPCRDHFLVTSLSFTFTLLKASMVASQATGFASLEAKAPLSKEIA